MIPPLPSQAKVDCGMFEESNQADPLKWAAQLPIGHALPSHPKRRCDFPRPSEPTPQRTLVDWYIMFEAGD